MGKLFHASIIINDHDSSIIFIDLPPARVAIGIRAVVAEYAAHAYW